MADYGFAVKKSGVAKNVGDCTIQELYASSKFNCFKIAEEGAITATFDPNNATAFTYYHHSIHTFQPAVLAFAELKPGQYFGESWGTSVSNFTHFIYWSGEDTATPNPSDKFITYVVGYDSGSSYSGVKNFRVKQFILGDTLNNVNTQTTLSSVQDYGIKIMNQGYDANTDNYIEHLIWSSRFPPMKIANISSLSMTIPAGSSNTVSYTHGLGYAPAFMCMREGASGQFSNLPYDDGTGTDMVTDPNNFAVAYSTNTAVTIFEKNGTGSSITKNYKCITFGERLD